jgi:choline dehydrogenase-like flavoprotein
LGYRTIPEFDYIIVGAGSAGCVLAYRLGEDRDVSILVVEAGGEDRDPLIHIPLGMGRMHAKRSHDWGYDFEPEPTTADRAIEAMRGKVVGGSSAINHMSHVRGSPGDYDRWAASGLRDWSYEAVLPYFRRSESWARGGNTYRGGDGPLSIVPASAQDPLLEAFIEAGAASGLPYNEDYNAERQDGMGRGQFTIRRGRRHTAADAYLRPALARGNVTLRMQAHVTRAVIEGTKATGIEYTQRGEITTVRARREVILSGGSFNTPQLLMLSGIGPADHLRQHDIEPVLDLPGVGGCLQDHMSVNVAGTRPEPGLFQRELRFDRMAISMVRAHLFGTGPATMLPGGLHGYVRINPALGVPDIQLMFRATSSFPRLWFPGIRNPMPDSCGVRVNLLHPKSRGRVRLRSANPLDKVRIEGAFLTEEEDVRTLRAGVRFARNLLAQRTLDRYRGNETVPGPKIKSDAEIDTWIRASAVTVHHPASTCAMGTRNDSVVDGDLRVNQLEGLRLVDASVMPDLVSGNINACVVMIAEKASDIIRGHRQ